MYAFFFFSFFVCSLLCLTFLGPTTPYSSVEHGNFAYVGYTGVFNILDYSAVSFPCGVRVDENVDRAYPDQRPPLSELDAQVQSSCECLQ